jgi:hypothetical protein
MHLVLAAAFVFAPQAVRAEGGELALEMLSGHEIAIVRHPNLVAAPKTWPSIYLPRLALHVTYGVTQRLNAGLGIEGTLPKTVITRHAMYQKANDADLVASYSALDLPLLLEYWHFTGTDWTWTMGLAAGYSFIHWADASLHGSDVGAHSFPVDPLSAWTPTLFGRVAAGGVWRPSDHFALRAGVSVALKAQGDLHTGLWLAADLLAGAGPALW